MSDVEQVEILVLGSGEERDPVHFLGLHIGLVAL
jgi:hypothetical protein